MQCLGWSQEDYPVSLGSVFSELGTEVFLLLSQAGTWPEPGCGQWDPWGEVALGRPVQSSGDYYFNHCVVMVCSLPSDSSL